MKFAQWFAEVALPFPVHLNVIDPVGLQQANEKYSKYGFTRSNGCCQINCKGPQATMTIPFNFGYEEEMTE